MRRLAPRPLSAVLAGAVGEARPAGLLAAVQSAWATVAGPALAAAAEPAAERSGTVTVTCESGVWAQELELLAPDLTARLNEHLEGVGEPSRVERLRFVVGSGANRR
jgi:predicted nucleic acid-binding Zn ribbon protein